MLREISDMLAVIYDDGAQLHLTQLRYSRITVRKILSASHSLLLKPARQLQAWVSCFGLKMHNIMGFGQARAGQ